MHQMTMVFDLSGWWLLALPAVVAGAALALMLGIRLAGGRIGFFRSLAAVVISWPAWLTGFALGVIMAGPFGALILPLAAALVVIKIIAGVGWAQALIALLAVTVFKFLLILALATATGLGMMEMMRQFVPPWGGGEVEVMLRSLGR